MERRKAVFHAVPSVDELYPHFRVQARRNFTSFPQVKEELNVCMAVIYATLVFKTC